MRPAGAEPAAKSASASDAPAGRASKPSRLPEVAKSGKVAEVAKSFQQLWENKPGALVLLLLGFVVFLFLVVDAWRHKRRSKRPR